jgi:hypothetical protein
MKRLTDEQEAWVRQASAESFPHPVPPGEPPRRRNISNPSVSNPNLWAFYSVPEIRAIADRVSNGVERVTFRPCATVEGATGDKCPPLVGEDGGLAEGISPKLAADAAVVWSQVRSPSSNQSDIFGPIATSLMVAGDAWQFGYMGNPEMRYDPLGKPMWVGVARSAITERNEMYEVQVGIDGCVKVPIFGDDHGTAIRIWIPNPQAPALADSWMTSCVRSLTILAAIYEAVAAVALSRLNAGIIVAPSDQDQLPIPSAAQVGDGNPALYPLGTNLQQRLYDEIGDHIEASAQEVDGWSRAAPAVIGVDSSIADKVKWIQLARDMDPGLGTTIDDLRERIAMASPVPEEVILGLGDTNHWNGQQIDQAEYQRAILPVCERIAWPNTEHVLRAGLVEQFGYSMDEAMKVQVGYTAKNLLMPPDRSDSAVKVAGLPNPIPALSNAELREATGLGDFAGPDEDEARMHSVFALAQANPTYGYLLPLVGLPAPPQELATPTEVVDVNSTETAVALPAGVRQAAAKPKEDRETGRRLMALATSFEERLAVLTEAIVTQMTKRASSKIANLSRSKAWADIRATVHATMESAPDLVGAIPRVQSKLAAEGVDDGDLFEPVLAGFAAQYETLTRRTQRAAVRELGADWEPLEADADAANLASWALLGTLLIGEARRRFEGVLPEQVVGEGALSPFGIPSAVISRVSALAGGQLDVVEGGVNSRTSPQGWSTISTGPLSDRAAEMAGKVVLGYYWDYRPELERNSFMDHLDLHNVFGFNEDDFDGFYVGDHAGCLCGLTPQYGAL